MTPIYTEATNIYKGTNDRETHHCLHTFSGSQLQIELCKKVHLKCNLNPQNKVISKGYQYAGRNELALQLSLLFRRHEHSNVIFLNIHEGHTRMSHTLKVKLHHYLIWHFSKAFIRLVAALLHFFNLKMTAWWISITSKWILNMRKEEKRGTHVRTQRWDGIQNGHSINPDFPKCLQEETYDISRSNCLCYSVNF